MKIILLSSCLKRNIRASGADPGFSLGGGAPLRNDVTAGEVKKKFKSEYVYTKKKASSQGGGWGGGGGFAPLHPPPRSAPG